MPRPKRERPLDNAINTSSPLLRLPRKQIVELLRQFRDGALPAACSEGALAANINVRFDSIRISHEFEFDSEVAGKRGAFKLEMVDPGLLVQHVLQACPKFALAYAEALDNHPGSQQHPWHLIVGFDEYNPGSQFNFHATKKMMALYFTFKEVFDPRNRMWFCPLVIRTRIASTLLGGTSHVFAWFLRRMLFGPNGLATAGVCFTVNNIERVFFANLGILLSDGDGLRLALGWRGAGSLKPCVRHVNVWKKDSDLCDRMPGNVVASVEQVAWDLARTEMIEWAEQINV